MICMLIAKFHWNRYNNLGGVVWTKMFYAETLLRHPTLRRPKKASAGMFYPTKPDTYLFLPFSVALGTASLNQNLDWTCRGIVCRQGQTLDRLSGLFPPPVCNKDMYSNGMILKEYVVLIDFIYFWSLKRLLYNGFNLWWVIFVVLNSRFDNARV